MAGPVSTSGGAFFVVELRGFLAAGMADYTARPKLDSLLGSTRHCTHASPACSKVCNYMCFTKSVFRV